MTNHEYTKLIETNPRITLSGFKTGRKGFDKDACDAFHSVGIEMLKKLRILCEDCCQYLRWRNKLERGVHLSDVRDAFQNYNLMSSNPILDIPLGVVMLAAIHEGYRIRQVKGSFQGRIIGKRR